MLHNFHHETILNKYDRYFWQKNNKKALNFWPR